jgi:hypothetical protein
LRGEERFDEFEIAHCHLVEFKRRGVLLKSERIDVQRLVLLRGADVMQNNAGGDGRGLMPDEPETFKRSHLKLAL